MRAAPGAEAGGDWLHREAGKSDPAEQARPTLAVWRKNRRLDEAMWMMPPKASNVTYCNVYFNAIVLTK